MAIKIETNKRGVEELVGENSRGQKHVFDANRIFIRAADGHVFLGPSIPLTETLARLNPHEADMVRHWLGERSGGHTPNVFAGEPPSG